MPAYDIYSAEELAAHKFPDEPFLVEPLIPQGGIVLLHGKRGIGKSQFSLTLAHTIVNGFPLFNYFPVTKSKVVVVETDMTPQIQQLRILKIFDRLCLKGLYYTFPVPCNVIEFHSGHPLVKAILEIGPNLIIWDTLRKIHRMKESSSESVQIVYENLRTHFPGITHMLIHHDKKTFQDNEGLDQEELFRGSGAWVDDADTSLQITETGPRMKIWIHKCRTMSEGDRPNLLVEMDPETMLLHPYQPNTAAKMLPYLRQTFPDYRKEQLVEELLRRGCCTRDQGHLAVKMLV